jgi:hypothetical protein
MFRRVFWENFHIFSIVFNAVKEWLNRNGLSNILKYRSLIDEIASFDALTRDDNATQY